MGQKLVEKYYIYITRILYDNRDSSEFQPTTSQHIEYSGMSEYSWLSIGSKLIACVQMDMSIKINQLYHWKNQRENL